MSTWPSAPILDPAQRLHEAETALVAVRQQAAQAWAEREAACEREVADARREAA